MSLQAWELPHRRHAYDAHGENLQAQQTAEQILSLAVASPCTFHTGVQRMSTAH